MANDKTAFSRFASLVNTRHVGVSARNPSLYSNLGCQWSPILYRELNKALAESETQPGTIVLLVSNAGFIESHEIDYQGGLRYPHLVRNNDARDYLNEILSPALRSDRHSAWM